MEAITVVIPVFNRCDVTKQCVGLIRRQHEGGSVSIVLVDNGSTDETEKVFSRNPDVVYIRNSGNLGVSRACNAGAARAPEGILCFMHNDVFIEERDWLEKISRFLVQRGDRGIIGLYGAQQMRRDGSFRGRTIVHAQKDAPAMPSKAVRVAVVDGLLMAMRRSVFAGIGGFSPDFPIHYYDKDISLRAHAAGVQNYVLHIPFIHLCNTTRRTVAGENAEREQARQLFVERWASFLPLDVRSRREKLRGVMERIGLRP